MTAHAGVRRPAGDLLSQPAVSADMTVSLASGSRLDANGTVWRLRSLIAMGHDCSRIARALRVSPDLVRRIVRGQSRTVTRAFHATACQLWDAWWDKTPPRRTPDERRAAARALRHAEASNWPAAVGLDEDELDEPGYRPWCRYRPAAGTGTAPDFTPAQPARRTPGGSRDHGRSAANETEAAMTHYPAASGVSDMNDKRQMSGPRRGEEASAAPAPTTQNARQTEKQAVAGA